MRAVDSMVTAFVRRNLRGVWVRGLPSRATAAVWAANHHSWWDPFVATAVGERTAIMVSRENLTRFGMARAIGAFGTHEMRRGLAYLQSGRQVIVYPEGALRPQGPVWELARGAAWLARVGRAPLFAVACRVVLRGQQAPEAYLSFAAVEPGGLAQELSRQVSRLDRLLATEDPRLPLPGFTLAVRGRRSVDERLAWRRH